MLSSSLSPPSGSNSSQVAAKPPAASQEKPAPQETPVNQAAPGNDASSSQLNPNGSNASEKVQSQQDEAAPARIDSGQKEFEQARNILRGNHRQRDLSQAVSLLWTGVRKGYVPAEVTLADLYARGDGVGRSCDQARILLESAIQKGSPEGRRRLELLKRQGCF